jgi:lysine 6-dehydrogenase
MNAMVIGAGRMGRAIGHDLARSGWSVRYVDANPQAGVEVADVSRPTPALFKGADVAVSAVPFGLNLGLAKVAVAAGVHFCDLGGNDGVVAKEMALDRAASKKGVCIVPDCGLAPGMASFLVAWGLQGFTKPERVRVRVGGLPLKPDSPLNYQMVFSMGGLINEYRGFCRTLRKGRLARVRAMTGIEEVDFSGVGRLEAFNTSGGASTMPDTYRGQVGSLDYKTLRFPGHCVRMRKALRLKDPGAWVLKNVQPTGPDQVLVRVEIEGDGRTWTLTLRDVERDGFTAMQRTTGFSASIVAQLIATGRSKRKGALRQERDFDPAAFVAELRKRNFDLRVDGKTK